MLEQTHSILQADTTRIMIQLLDLCCVSTATQRRLARAPCECAPPVFMHTRLLHSTLGVYACIRVCSVHTTYHMIVYCPFGKACVRTCTSSAIFRNNCMRTHGYGIGRAQDYETTTFGYVLPPAPIQLLTPGAPSPLGLGTHTEKCPKEIVLWCAHTQHMCKSMPRAV